MGLSPLCSLPDSSLSHNCSQPDVNVKNFSSSQVASVCSCQVFQVKKCHKRLEKPEETTSQNASLLENEKFYIIANVLTCKNMCKLIILKGKRTFYINANILAYYATE